MKLKHFLVGCSILALTACTGAPQVTTSSDASESSDTSDNSSVAAISSAAPVVSSSAASSSSAGPVVGNGDTPLERGRDLYFRDLSVGSCASCHGDLGEGIQGKGGALFGAECHSCGEGPSALVAIIDTAMPTGGAHLCRGDCATETATFIYETFVGKPFSLSCEGEIQKASPMRRLNKVEIVNAVSDVFGAGAEQVENALPDEQEVIGGFATVGSALTTSNGWTASLADGLLDAADRIVESGKFPACADSSVPLVEPIQKCTSTTACQGVYPSATDCNVGGGGICLCGAGQSCSGSGYGGDPNFNGGDPNSNGVGSTDCFDDATRKAAKLLFREPLSNTGLNRLKALRASVSNATGSPKDGDKAVVLSLLTSPKFVFSLAADSKSVGRELTSKEMADRLALTLWGSVPDETLIDLAANNQLKGGMLETQIDRMLEDARFDRFASVFGDAWIGLGGYLLEAEDLNTTPEELNALLSDLKTETHTFIRHIIKNNLPINELYTANYSFLNARLQAHYDFSVTTNNQTFVKTTFPADSSRRGLMTQAAILAKAFDGTKTSVVKRGVLPLEAFSCTAPEPPSGDLVDAANMQAASGATEKEKIASRAASGTCASCHASIDPVGWVFTEFGPAGESASVDPDGDPLNTSGVLYNQNFANAHSMVDVLVTEDKFASCFSTKFLIHSIGRRVSYNNSLEDQCAIDNALDAAEVNDSVRARDLIKALLRSDIATVTGTIEQQ